MRKLFVTAIMLGLFAVTPAAFARGDHNQSEKSDQRGQSDQGGKPDRAKSDQGAKPDNARGENAAPAQSNSRNTAIRAERKAMKSNRSRNAAATNRTRNVQNNFRSRNALTTNSKRNNPTRNAETTDRATKTFTANRTADYSSLRSNVQSSHRYHAGSYRQPYGYHSRRWSYGQRLPTLYFVSDYWITDYLDYALFAPSDGLVWVRVGDDALLIDRYNGEIIRVEYGVFY